MSSESMLICTIVPVEPLVKTFVLLRELSYFYSNDTLNKRIVVFSESERNNFLYKRVFNV